ncbi:MAG: amidohydrolase, partial [Planctomycetota bacterium]
MATTTEEGLRQIIDNELPRIRELRHDIHRHPEVMFEEQRTSQVVSRELQSLGIEHVNGLAGGTGVLGFLPATTSPDSARTVALRADMDALPITEETGCDYASINQGVMHACGHDGHTAILLGAARTLARMPERSSNALFVFQPAEEGGAGADKMCKDGALDGSKIGRPADMIYGLHGWPDLEVGKVATRVGTVLAATDEFIIKVRGR